MALDRNKFNKNNIKTSVGNTLVTSAPVKVMKVKYNRI